MGLTKDALLKKALRKRWVSPGTHLNTAAQLLDELLKELAPLIPIKEREPEYGQDCLFFLPEEGFFRALYKKDSYFIKTRKYNFTPTHWAVLLS